MRHPSWIEVRPVDGKGRGVFAVEPIRNGSLIERVPLLVVPIEFIQGGWNRPDLARFFFVHSSDALAVALGYGSIYNHSYTPNARYDHDSDLTLSFFAIEDIKPGEEICINYNNARDDRRDVGFHVVE